MFKKKGDSAVLAKLGDAPAPFGEIGKRLHRVITESAPGLEPVVRWGLAFYVEDGEDICYLKPDEKSIVFGVGELRNPVPEDGTNMQPVAWTVTSLDPATEERVRDLVAQAIGRPTP